MAGAGEGGAEAAAVAEAAAAEAAARIGPLRGRIDEITLEMVGLLKERADAAAQIGAAKREAGIAIPDAAREESLRQRVDEECARLGADARAGGRLLDLLLGESVRVQAGGAAAGSPAAAAVAAHPPPSPASIFLRARRIEESEGRPIVHMEVGEPDFGPPAEAVEALSEACRTGRRGYGPPAGSPELRDALAERASAACGRPIARENVVVTAGARFAIYLATAALLKPGDEVVVVEPAWPAYADLARRAGASVRPVRTRLEDGWEPDIGEIERAASGPRARMIVANYPNNPTGKVVSQRALGRIAGIAADRGLRLVSDEIYSEYVFGPDGGEGGGAAGKGAAPTAAPATAPTACGLPGCIATQSFSKSHAMTGFRVGYAVGPEEDIAAMAGLQALCMTSVPTPVQYAALMALGTGAAASNARIVRRRIGALCAAAESAGLEFARPGGAMYLFARGRGRRAFDGARLADTLLEHGVGVAPGAGFGTDGTTYGGFVRLAACVGEDAIASAVAALGSAIEGGGAAARGAAAAGSGRPAGA